MLTGYITGVINNHICMKKGITYLISRYFTFSAESNIPVPRVSKISGTIIKGHNITVTAGENPKYSITIISKTKAMAKSSNPANTGAAGIAILGKYTLVIRFVLATRLLPEKLSATEKYVQGIKALRTKIGYGIPSLGIFARLPKNIVNTNIVNRG